MMKNIIRNSVSHIKKAVAVVLFISYGLSLCSCAKNQGGFNGKRFDETRHITVQVDSLKDKTKNGEITVQTSACAKYIHDAVLRDCNIDVEFVDSNQSKVYYGITADISFTSDYNQVTTYYKMNSINNLSPLIEEYSDSLTELKELLGDYGLYSSNEDHSEIMYLTARKTEPDARVTFIRKDWLDKLGLSAPSNREELYTCLVAFRDNADILLGDDAEQMIPFFVDGDPSLSAKPLFDSCLDTAIESRDFYDHGFRRTTQDGYKDGLEILNSWYLQDLLPHDFKNITPLSKETYEPIENGYVGAFCAKATYLYANGENSHISALHANCGDNAEYIAVNTFENRYGEYTHWEEDYLNEGGRKLFIQAACLDPQACLVYLNWLSDPENIEKIQSISDENPDDPYGFDRYLITCQGSCFIEREYPIPEALKAIEVAQEVKIEQRGCKCIRHGPYYFTYVNSEIDLAAVYPDSTKTFICEVITSTDEDFESSYKESFRVYLNNGAYMLYKLRDLEWEKVMVEGDMTPW